MALMLRRSERLADAATLLLVGSGPVVVELVLQGSRAAGNGWRLLAVGAGLSIGLTLARGRWMAQLALFVLAAAAASSTIGAVGRAPAALLIASTAVIDLALEFRRRRGGPVPFTATFVVAIAGAVWVRTSSLAVVLCGLVVAAFVVAADRMRPREIARIDGRAADIVAGLVVVIEILVVGLLAVPALYIPAVVGFPIRWLGSRQRRRGGSNWRTREVAEIDELRRASSPFAPEARVAAVSRNLAALAAVIAIVALLVRYEGANNRVNASSVRTPMAVGGAMSPTPTVAVVPTRPPPRNLAFRLSETPAFEDVPWADAIQAEQENMQSDLTFGELGLGDVSSKYTNVSNGVRRSVDVPCDCPSVSVWWFGASTAFGWFERDDHTITSELVRIAASDGIDLRIENRAVAGWTVWQEQQLFSGLLTFSDKRPDLALFFDGFNDVLATTSMAHRLQALPPETTPAYIVLDDLGPLRDPDLSLDPAGGPGAIGRLAADKYLRTAETIRNLATAEGIETQFVLQPDALGSERHLPNASLSLGTDGRRFLGSDLVRVFAAAESRFGDRVMNLRHVFDDTSEPVFPDTVHLTERGARLVAEELYQRLGPQLRKLAR